MKSRAYRIRGVLMLSILAQSVGFRLVADCLQCGGSGRTRSKEATADDYETSPCASCEQRQGLLEGTRRLLGNESLTEKMRAERERLLAVLSMVFDEHRAAKAKHSAAYENFHHGWAVLYEEVDELWDEVKRSQHKEAAITHEAIQVAQVAVRFVFDLCRIGCVACSDATCDKHAGQDSAGDYAMDKQKFRARRKENVGI